MGLQQGGSAGEPLADFAGAAWAEIESGRLTELRLAALSERADRLLTLGRFDQVVAELEPIAAVDPTRERLVGQLMTGLFNAGRQADALARSPAPATPFPRTSGWTPRAGCGR